jgi:hypothetical protein
LAVALATSESDVAAFFGSLSLEEFDQRVGTAWSPAQHLDHLNIAVSATARGFSAPTLLLRVRFGRARRPSRTFEQLRADYLALLGTGAGATDRFVPAADDSSAHRRDALLARWHRVNDRLRSALASWPERDLDRLQLPHPLLGRITARELVFFTIYHGPHHIAAARRRLNRFAADESGS